MVVTQSLYHHEQRHQNGKLVVNVSVERLKTQQKEDFQP